MRKHLLNDHEKSLIQKAKNYFDVKTTTQAIRKVLFSWGDLIQENIYYRNQVTALKLRLELAK